jgi:beta-lactamase class A
MPAARRSLAFFAATLLASFTAHAQLHSQLERIAAQARGHVNVACSLPGRDLDCNLRASDPLPMQSVYKLPIAVAMLHAVEIGRFTLTQTLHIVPSELVASDGYSPLRDEHPHGAVDVSIEELVRRAVSQSDNAASDALLGAVGGPAVVSGYLRSIGIAGISVMDSELALGRDERLQYRNAAPPGALVALLRRLADRSPLSPEDTHLLLASMYASHTGDSRLKALLPSGTAIADKTGTCGQNRPTINATNDIGLITLPNGQKIAVAVLVADATAPFAVRERVIAQIGKAIYAAAAH